MLNGISGEVQFVTKIKGEPTEENICQLTSSIEIIPDTIVGIGGGSVLDSCKLILPKLVYPNKDLSNWSEPFSFDFSHHQISLVSIPTTYSGSEVSSSTLYSSDKNYKSIILSHHFISKSIIYDPVLLESLPDKVSINSTLDAFSHSMEGYLSNKPHPKMYPLVVDSLKSIIAGITSIDQTFDNNLREELLLASFKAGLVQNHCSTGLCHSIAHQLSRFGLSHGRLIAIFIPRILEYYYGKDQTKLDSLAEDLDFVSGQKIIEWLSEVQKSVSILNFDEKIKESIISSNLAREIKSDMTYSTSPLDISDADLYKLISISLK